MLWIQKNEAWRAPRVTGLTRRVGAVHVLHDQLAAVVLLGAAEEQRHREVGADAEGRARHLAHGVVDVGPEGHPRLVTVEERREHAQRQGRRDEERTALERGHDRLAHLAGFGAALGNLQVVLRLGRLVPGGDAPVDPGGARHQLAAARHLGLGQHARNVNQHLST
jgi:hypothetical protein